MSAQLTEGGATEENANGSRDCRTLPPSALPGISPSRGENEGGTRTGHLNRQAEGSGLLRTLPSPQPQPEPPKTRRERREPEPPQHAARQSGREPPSRPPSGGA